MDTPIQSALDCVDQVKDRYLIQNQCVGHSVELWREAVKRFKLHREGKVLGWPAYDPQFDPARHDHRYKTWISHNITAICKIISNGDLDNFKNLCQNFDLNRQDFYRYLQVRLFFGRRSKALIIELSLN